VQRDVLWLRKHRTQRSFHVDIHVDNPQVRPYPCVLQYLQLIQILSGAWIVVPTYMGWVFAKDILRGLTIASGDSSSKPARAIQYSKEE